MQPLINVGRRSSLTRRRRFRSAPTPLDTRRERQGEQYAESVTVISAVFN